LESSLPRQQPPELKCHPARDPEADGDEKEPKKLGGGLPGNEFIGQIDTDGYESHHSQQHPGYIADADERITYTGASPQAKTLILRIPHRVNEDHSHYLATET
jgi:hypothetical protein